MHSCVHGVTVYEVRCAALQVFLADVDLTAAQRSAHGLVEAGHTVRVVKCDVRLKVRHYLHIIRHYPRASRQIIRYYLHRAYRKRHVTDTVHSISSSSIILFSMPYLPHSFALISLQLCALKSFLQLFSIWLYRHSSPQHAATSSSSMTHAGCVHDRRERTND